MSLQSLIGWLLPQEHQFYEMLEELARLSNEAAKALERFRDHPAAEVRQAVQAIEHQADDVVRRMEDALARTFVTPLDREDLHRLTSELDDIIDLTNLTGRALQLYHVERPTEAMVQLMANLVTVTELIRNAVPRLRKKQFAELLDEGRRVRAMEKEADTIYRSAISNLFRMEQIDFRELLKQKEALDDVERAVDQCDTVADLLSNLAVKHG
jgi:predicted phosphate transport protein (TIGR00153 family)